MGFHWNAITSQESDRSPCNDVYIQAYSIYCDWFCISGNLEDREIEKNTEHMQQIADSKEENREQDM